MIPLIAIVTARVREGMRDDALEALQEAQRATHDEAGCRLYALHVDESDPRTLVMIEGWDSEEALAAHVASTHVGALMAKSDALLDGPVEIQRLTALPFGGLGKGEL